MVWDSFRDASALIFQSGEFLNSDVRRDLIGKLNAVPSKKVERAVRLAMLNSKTDKEKILAIKDELELAGIQKPEPPTPLEIISENQVKLVTWMAVKGKFN